MAPWSAGEQDHLRINWGREVIWKRHQGPKVHLLQDGGENQRPRRRRRGSPQREKGELALETG